MIKQVLLHIVSFLFLLLFQIAILNNINFGGKINPYLYVLFILALPFSISKAWVLLLSFVMGLTIDLFVYTPGIHAAATVFLGFSRNVLLPFFEPRDGYVPGSKPSVSDYGWGWYLRYTIILVVLHHISLFLLDAFSFSNLTNTIFNSLSSAAFTILLITFTQTSYSRRKNST